jgi:hypothetical protein
MKDQFVGDFVGGLMGGIMNITKGWFFWWIFFLS